MSPEGVKTAASERKAAIERRSNKLWARFHQAIFADATVLEEISDG